MGNTLTKNSTMKCSQHGLGRPAFIGSHLQHGEGIGIFEANEKDPDFPFRSAWCDACDTVISEQGEWNDISEGHAQVMLICEGCLNEIQTRNSQP